jgi:MFS family permease
MKNNSDKLAVVQQVGIYAFGFTMFGAAAISPALGALQAVYPDTPAFVITMIGSLPSLFVIFGALFCGAIVGKYINYKVLGLIALFLYGVTGVLPFWIHPSIEAVLALRAMNGLANGLLFPMANAAILRCVQDKEYRASYLGMAQSLGSGGSIILTLAGGYLGAISGIHTFLVYSLAFVCFLVVIVCFKEPPTLDEIIARNPAYQSEELNAKRVKLPPLCWLFLIFGVGYQLFQSPVLMTIPLSLPPEEAGSVGLIMSFFTIGSFILAALTGRFVKTFKRLTASVYLVLGAVGIGFVVFSGGNLVVVAIGALILGFGIGAFVMVSFELSMLTTPAGMAWAAGLVMVATNLGNFLSSYWFGLLGAIFGTNTMAIQASGLVGFLLLAVLWAVVDYGPNKGPWLKKAGEEAAGK